jgi:Uma2 family endonuclease
VSVVKCISTNSLYLYNMLRTSNPPETNMEVYKTLPEGTLAEIIDNQIFMSPSPSSKHQKVLNKINNKLYNYLESSGLGEVYTAPLDVYLDEISNAIQPDIIVVLTQNLRIVNANGHIHGTPDLLIEILSPGNKEYDLVKKKDLYEQFGVEEYWIIDPDTKLALVYHLTNGKYQKIGENIGVLSSPLLNTKVEF